MKNVNLRRLVIAGAVILIVSFILLFTARDVVREAIVIPVSYWIWVIGLFVDSTPQIFFWIMLLLISLFIAYRSTRPPKKDPAEPIPYRDYSRSNGVNYGRVAYWSNRVNTMHMGSFYRSMLNELVGRLLLDLLSYRHRLTPRQIETRLEKGQFVVPPEIKEYLTKNVLKREIGPIGFFPYLFRQIRAWFVSKFVSPGDPRTIQPDQDLDRVLHYIEEELEVKYDRPSL